MTSSLLEGTWNLISCEALNSAGQSAYPYGEHPFGRLMLDATDRLAFFITDSERPRFSSDDPSEAIGQEIVGNYSKADAYFGKYFVNDRYNTLTVAVEGSIFPNLTGTEQVLTYELTGRILKTHSRPNPWRGEMWTYYSIWERV